MDIKHISNDKILSLIKRKTDDFYIIPEFLNLSPGNKKYYLIDWNGNKLIFSIIIIINVSYRIFKINQILCPAAPVILDGFLSDQEKFQMINEFGKKLLKIYNPQFLSFTQLPTLAPFFSSNPFHNEKWKYTTSFSAILNLSSELSKLYYSLEKRTRYILRKFTKFDDKELISDEWINNLQNKVEISEDYRDLKYFYKNWNQIKRKIILKGLEPSKFLEESILNTNFEILSKAKFVKHFIIFDKNEEVGTSSIIFTVKDPLIHSIGYYSAGASSENGRRCGLPTILQWFIINWLKNNGFQFYDLGGISSTINHGPSIFKRGFGGKLVKGWTLSKQSRLNQILNILNLIKKRRFHFISNFLYL